MKTSNKILSGALVLFFIALVIYNVQLKAEYLTGNYKKPHKDDLNKIDVKDFTEIQLNAANMMDVELKQGPFAVYIRKGNEDSIQIKKVGRRLVVDLNIDAVLELGSSRGSKDRFINEHRSNGIIIVCPNLSLLKTDDAFLVRGKKLDKYSYTDGSSYDSHREIDLQLFKLDTLMLIQKGRSQVSLSGNEIKSLKADVGRQSSINIRGNIIGNLDLDIKAGAELALGKLNGLNGPTKTTYQISDSSHVRLSGAALKTIIKQKP